MPSNLNLDHYYDTEADRYSFCRVPKPLLTDPRIRMFPLRPVCSGKAKFMRRG